MGSMSARDLSARGLRPTLRASWLRATASCRLTPCRGTAAAAGAAATASCRACCPPDGAAARKYTQSYSKYDRPLAAL